MDSNIQSPPLDGADAKTAFRKPSNDAASRKYRRHSPASRSSSSDGSPRRDRSSSPNDGKKDPEKVSDNQHRRNDDRREVDRDSGRNQYSRSSDSYRQSDRQSSRGSHGYRRHYDNRRDRCADEEERNYHKSSSRSSHDLREGSRSDKFDGEHNRSRDCIRDVDRYSRDKYDGAGHKTKEKEIEDQKYKDRDILSEKTGSGRRLTNSSYEEKIKSGERDRHVRDGDGRNEKRDHHRSIGDGKSDHMPYYEESRGHRTESASRKDSGGNRLKDTHKSDPRELDLSKYTREDKRKYKDLESGRHKDRYSRESGEYEDKAVFANEGQDSPSKKSKIFSLDKGTDSGKDVVKSSTTAADDRRSPISKQDEGVVHKVTPAEANANGSEVAGDLNAAKVAAMKAAELVNRNLVGTGVLSADQKKKLLWGNKKSTTAEESGHRWDATLFPDRERQEKFNKLMGVKGDLKIEHKPENPDGSSVLLAEKQKELQLDLEKQYTAGLRRRDGRTVGLGL